MRDIEMSEESVAAAGATQVVARRRGRRVVWLSSAWVECEFGWNFFNLDVMSSIRKKLIQNSFIL